MRLSTVMLLAALGAAPSYASAQSVNADDGKRLFDHRCGMCHSAIGMGTGLLARRVGPGEAELEKRGNLAAPFVVAVARNGMGNMPAITRGDVSDAELAKIAAYLAKGPAQ